MHSRCSQRRWKRFSMGACTKRRNIEHCRRRLKNFVRRLSYAYKLFAAWLRRRYGVPQLRAYIHSHGYEYHHIYAYPNIYQDIYIHKHTVADRHTNIYTHTDKYIDRDTYIHRHCDIHGNAVNDVYLHRNSHRYSGGQRLDTDGYSDNFAYVDNNSDIYRFAYRHSDIHINRYIYRNA